MSRWCLSKENLAASNSTCKINLINGDSKYGADAAFQDCCMILMCIKERVVTYTRIGLVCLEMSFCSFVLPYQQEKNTKLLQTTFSRAMQAEGAWYPILRHCS